MRIAIHYLLLLVTMLAVMGSAKAATYHVAPTGDDAHVGTESQPFRTLNRSVQGLAPGDTLVIAPATYEETLSNNIPSGISWEQPVTLKAASAGTVTLRPKPGSARVIDFGLLAGRPQQFIVVDGLILDGIHVGYNAVKFNAGAHHIRIIRCDVRNAKASGILAGSSADYCEFIDLVVHDNGIEPGDHGLYLHGDHILVEGCRLYNNFTLGFRNSGTPNAVIRNNLVHNNGTVGHGRITIAMEIGGLNFECYNNLVYDNPGGIIVYGGGKVFNNTICRNGSWGLQIACGTRKAEVFNNIVYDNRGGGIHAINCGPESRVERNLAFQNAVGHPQLKPTERNFYNPAGVPAWRDNVEADPKFADGEQRGFHLAAGSPAIDAGLPTGELVSDAEGHLRPLGKGVDLGALEFGSTAEPLKNQPPRVSAGADTWTSLPQPVALRGTVEDDGHPQGKVDVAWTFVLGPGRVVFSNPHAMETTATFNEPGAYVLRLSADDGQYVAGGLVTVYAYSPFEPGKPIRIEAEQMRFSVFDLREAPFASRGKYLSHPLRADNRDDARALFPGPAGIYDVVVGYFDQEGAKARQRFCINRSSGRVADVKWVYDQDLPGDAPSEANLARRTLLTNIELRPGDLFFTDGYESFIDGAETATLDYFEFIPKGSMPPQKPKAK